LKILEYTFEKTTEYLNKEFGKGKFHAAGICREIFKNGNKNIYKAKEFSNSKELSAAVMSRISISPGIIHDTKSEDNTTKYITKLNDGLKVESVIVPMNNYTTLCISSQAGCRFGCIFCETGKKGFSRNLSTEEIIGQLYNARFILKNSSIKNIVFMGMGEPLDNTENVIKAVKIMSDQRCFNIARKNITLSTIGIPDQMEKLSSDLNPVPNLAVSLNSAVNHIRSKIMPINKKYDLNDLRNALLSYPLRSSSAILFEYVLMSGINDSFADAQKLIDFVKAFKARVNIIPYNENSCADISSPSYEKVKEFSKWLADESVFVRMRTRKGSGLMAACGQLGKNFEGNNI
jgi:23S rRNA (adenine2503-C2)-methyltransferase